ncbi:Fructose-biphosphate aldolase [Klebsormidium nitens]|uniref:fructose-bisphosphate aldolase n=1 Tax=Klebsormidium nitens TaxID=105231 RepID=A0A1Y1HS79_KLENI|nr:Fructose-biphosphate aldolase [Klebsormidium nitens]|eukprot:GAQ78678.1 Fructose-biphosphate aldolase [Klebsormidium nitens]
MVGPAPLDEVIANANKLAQPGKGILASDESTRTVGKRLQSVGLDNTEANRQAFREMLYTTPGIGQYLSGAILFHETLFQSTANGTPFVKVLGEAGILPGIKVDVGLVPIPGTDGETSTLGLDDLTNRSRAYYEQGARFAKWRAVLKIGANLPSSLAIAMNARDLARYASICQQSGLVPIVEPEILIDGDHTLERSAEVAERVFAAVVAALHEHRVCLEGILLKPQMILPGAESPQKASPEEIAAATLRTLRRTIPPAVPGVMFLSGGQSEQEATVNLNTLNSLALQTGGAPWTLSFSFGRALQASPLRIWSGDASKVEEAQEMAVGLARVNAEAVLGKYSGPHPSKLTASLRENFRGWRQGEPR